MKLEIDGASEGSVGCSADPRLRFCCCAEATNDKADVKLYTSSAFAADVKLFGVCSRI
jgi:hypothetical protein